MSSPIYCPDCDKMVDETGWGDEDGEYHCSDCDLWFRQEIKEDRIEVERLDSNPNRRGYR